MSDIVERLAEHLYGHSREKAIEWAKEDKFDSCYRQAEDIIKLLGIDECWQWQHVAATTLARFVNHGTPFEGDAKFAEIADVATKLLAIAPTGWKA